MAHATRVNQVCHGWLMFVMSGICIPLEINFLLGVSVSHWGQNLHWRTTPKSDQSPCPRQDVVRIWPKLGMHFGRRFARLLTRLPNRNQS